MSGVNFAYHSYEKPMRTAHSKKYFRHLTPIYIFLGPIVEMKHGLLDSPRKDASNGSRLMSLGSIDNYILSNISKQ